MAITIIYPVTVSSGEPQITLSLPAALWGGESGYLNAYAIRRALDGTMYSDCSFLKRHKSLKWDCLTYAQKASIELLYASGDPFSFADSLDLDNQFNALIVAAPGMRQIHNGGWEVEMEVEEI